MLSRALSIATVTLVIGCLTAGAARAQNLDAGKSPSQIFSSTCNACHKSPRGLLKNTPASSLPGFLRQHYTTGSDMASVLSSYLISNGAADPRYQSKDQKKDARRDARQDARPEGRPEGRPEQPERLGRRQPAAAPAQEASRPDADTARPRGEGARPGRDGRRYGRQRVAPDAAQPADGQAPVQAATDSKTGVRQKHGRRGRPISPEPPKTEQMVPGNSAKEDDTSRDVSKSESAATDSARPAAAKPDSDSVRFDPTSTDAVGTAGDRSVSERVRETRPETAKVDGPKESAISEPNPLRPDPVTSAPASAAVAPELVERLGHNIRGISAGDGGACRSAHAADLPLTFSDFRMPPAAWLDCN